MKKEVEIILNFRKYLLAKIDGLSRDALNHIPEGYNNNIIWNLGHLNAVVQKLCYQNSGLSFTIDAAQVIPFLPGTSPEGLVTLDEVTRIKERLITSIVQLSHDFEKDIFTTYQPVEKVRTVYGIEVATIDDALKYITHHEGIHFRTIMRLKRSVKAV